MEEKDPRLMSFPSLPLNFISLQKLQQLRLQEKEEANKKKEDEVRVTSLKGEEENQNNVTDKPIASNRFYNHKKRYKGGRKEVSSLKTVEPAVDFEKSKEKEERVEEIKKPTTSNGINNHKKWYKGGREEVGLLKTVVPVDFEKSKKGKEKEEKEEEITKPTKLYKKKKRQNERRIRKEEGLILKTHETVDFEESKKSKEKEKEENQEKLHEDEQVTKPISFNGFYKKNHCYWIKVEEKLGVGLNSSEEIDLDKPEKKKKNKSEKRKEWNEKMKEAKLRKKLDRQRTLVDENASDEIEIKSKEDKDGISLNPTGEIVVDDDDKKKKTKLKEEEVNGDMKKKQPSIAATSTNLSNQTAEIVQKLDVIRVFGTDQKGKNRRSAVGMNRGFGGGFGNRRNARGRGGDYNEKNYMWVNRGFGGGFENRRNAKGRGGDDDEKNLIWVKKGENMNCV